ncbi:hypothetical protein O181_065487 [Austropuccinia psidii MF-1]|uniref:Uncharacterized protein n=1 Tax=Austropuccinia psidii MF-1 TaxID=1389203 RepID=A0A9Q3ETK2_9BASI|nr:hypothetical protein [Austropuccinia psidii MF-1]
MTIQPSASRSSAPHDASSSIALLNNLVIVSKQLLRQSHEHYFLVTFSPCNNCQLDKLLGMRGDHPMCLRSQTRNILEAVTNKK